MKIPKSVKKDLKKKIKNSDRSKKIVKWNVEVGDLVRCNDSTVGIVIEKRCSKNQTSLLVFGSKGKFWIDAAKARNVSENIPVQNNLK